MRKYGRLKIKFIKLDVSNWRIAKIKCRYIGGVARFAIAEVTKEGNPFVV